MTRIIVIDDDRNFSFYAQYARTSVAGLSMLQECLENGDRVTELWLDHDLGCAAEAISDYDTIMPVVNWLEEMAHNGTPLNVGMIYVHTANPSAAPVMMAALEKWYSVRRAVIMEA